MFLVFLAYYRVTLANINMHDAIDTHNMCSICTSRSKGVDLSLLLTTVYINMGAL